MNIKAIAARSLSMILLLRVALVIVAAFVVATGNRRTALAAGSLLFEEKFENASVASRGWYDNTTLSLSTAEHIPGSAASLEYHWTAGSAVPINGGAARHLFSASDSVQISFWLKYSSNWVGQNQVNYGHHEFYVLTDKDPAYSNLAYTHLTGYIEENNGVAQVAIQDGANIDETKVGVDLRGITENRAVSGCNGTYPDGYATLSCYIASGSTHWNGKQWKTGGTFFDSTPGSPTYKNSWHRIDVLFMMNSIQNGIGQQDGAVQYWYDGQSVIDHRNVVFRTGQNPTMRFNQFVMAPFMGDDSPVDQRFWIDDLTVVTGPSVIPTTAAPPRAPTNLRVTP
jgi:hypothetical protein